MSVRYYCHDDSGLVTMAGVAAALPDVAPFSSWTVVEGSAEVGKVLDADGVPQDATVIINGLNATGAATVTPDPTGILTERQTMRAYRLAITQALLTRPVTDSPAMNALYPAAPNLYFAIREYRDTLAHDNALAMALDNITQYIRLHADAQGIQTFLGVDDVWMDDLFRSAIAIEATAP